MEFERRTAATEIRVTGRKLTGVVMRYGEVSPSHRERFDPGSLRMAEAVHLDLFHDPERVIAWHPGGGMKLSNGRDALTMLAELPPIPAANRALRRDTRGPCQWPKRGIQGVEGNPRGWFAGDPIGRAFRCGSRADAFLRAIAS